MDGSTQSNTPPARPKRPRVVIIGSGYAGAYCAQKLEKLLGVDEADVTLIDRHNYFIAYPLLIEAGTGTLQPRHAVVPIRSFLRRETFLMSEVESVDLARREVTVHVVNDDAARAVPYDHLVLALGSVTNLPPVPGLKEYGYEMKSINHAIALRDRAIQMLELASATALGTTVVASGETDRAKTRDRIRAMLHFVVVGGNFTGVEVAGEFQDYMEKAAREYPGLSPGDVKVTIVDRNDKVLGVLDEPKLSEWAAAHLTRRGIDLRLKDSVTEVGPEHCVLKNGATLATRTVIWCAGIAPNPLLKTMDLPHDHGWILCERDGRVKGHENVWGIGDCAVNPDAAGKGYPATAQAAIREGALVARNLANVLRGQAAHPIDIVNQGALAAFGRFDAVAKIGSLKFTGFVAWFLWRTVYLLKMPGFGRKFRVATDWTLALLTKREFAEMGNHKLVRAAKAGTATADAAAAAQGPRREEAPAAAVGVVGAAT